MSYPRQLAKYFAGEYQNNVIQTLLFGEVTGFLSWLQLAGFCETTLRQME